MPMSIKGVTPMSQFPGGYQDPYGQAMMPPKKTSGLAIGALVCSLVGIVACGITAPIGVILGAVGFATTGPSAQRKGRGLSIAAIIIGVIVTVGWVYGGKMAYDFIGGFVKFSMEGPNEALTKGFAGDIPGFQASFHGDGATAPAAEAKSFLDMLEQRYGKYQSAAINQNSNSQPQSNQQPQITLPYTLTFANATVDADVELIFADQKTGTILKKLGFIAVTDATLGNLTFPSTAVPTGGSSSRRGSPAPPPAPSVPGTDTAADDAGADAPINSDTGSDGG